MAEPESHPVPSNEAPPPSKRQKVIDDEYDPFATTVEDPLPPVPALAASTSSPSSKSSINSAATPLAPIYAYPVAPPAVAAPVPPYIAPVYSTHFLGLITEFNYRILRLAHFSELAGWFSVHSLFFACSSACST